MISTFVVITVKEETKVLIVATIAWGLRKGSRAIELVLLFLIAMKPGFVHAVYSMFSCHQDNSFFTIIKFYVAAVEN